MPRFSTERYEDDIGLFGVRRLNLLAERAISHELGGGVVIYRPKRSEVSLSFSAVVIVWGASSLLMAALSMALAFWITPLFE